MSVLTPEQKRAGRFTLFWILVVLGLLLLAIQLPVSWIEPPPRIQAP